MSDAVLFILMFLIGGLVIHWYVDNRRRGDDGARGLLALTDEKAAEERASWRRKRGRVAPSRATGDASVLTARDREDGMTPAHVETAKKSAFRTKGEETYKRRGPLPRYGDRARKAPDDQA